MGDVHVISIVGEMVQNSQSLYLFIFTAVIVIHEYIYSHLRDVSFTFNGWYPFTFTIQIFIQHSAIFIQHFLRTPFAHREFCTISSTIPFRLEWFSWNGGEWNTYGCGLVLSPEPQTWKFHVVVWWAMSKSCAVEQHDPSLSFDHIIDLWRCRLTPTP